MPEDIFCAINTEFYLASSHLDFVRICARCDVVDQLLPTLVVYSEAFNQFMKNIIGRLVCYAGYVPSLFPLAGTEKLRGDLGGITTRQKFFAHDITARRGTSSTIFAVKFRLLET